MNNCRVCNIELFDDNWAESLRNKNSKICKSCHYKYCREWRKNNKDRFNKSARKYYHKNPQRHHDIANKSRLRVRLDMVTEYGGKCSVCSISDIDVLDIDHIDNSGANDRKKNLYGYNLYRHLKKLGWPKDNFQLLCKNCNWKKHLANIRSSSRNI